MANKNFINQEEIAKKFISNDEEDKSKNKKSKNVETEETIQFQVRIYKKYHLKLKRYCVDNEITMANFINEFVGKFLKENEL